MTPQDLSRRDVLRGLGGFAVLPAALGRPQDCSSTAIAAVPNRVTPFTGIQAYAQKSVAAGETIGFRVSCATPYTLKIMRLGWDTAGPSKDWELASFSLGAGEQPIRPGSYVHVESALPPTAALEELTLECWVRTFRPDTRQGVVAQQSATEANGFGLFLSELGKPAFRIGNGTQHPEHFASDSLAARRWYHLALVFSSGKAWLYKDGVEILVVNSGLPGFVQPGFAPLRIGALGDASGTKHFLEGDVAMPCMYLRALGAGEIQTRAQRSTPPSVPSDPDLIGCWPLDEEQGPFVADASACGRHGLIVNHGTWMIGGPSFAASLVDRFAAYDPDADPLRGHGLRLSSSDLYDCGWEVSQRYTLPNDCAPGVYVGRIQSGTSLYDVTFVVKRSSLRPPAPILVLCATNTWLAYNRPFKLFSFYKNHGDTDGPGHGYQPTYLQGLEMPWQSSTDPYQPYPPPADVGQGEPGQPLNPPPPDPFPYAHLVMAERYLHAWLEQQGYDYDVASDQDLHGDPDLLSPYRVVVVAGHSEYWSREAYETLRAYLAGGGRVVMASGNTMFWRVSFDGSILECRKLPLTVGGRPNAEWGELYHEHDHQRGGLMRECRAPEWETVALECVGYGKYGSYSVTDNSHAYFNVPEPLGVQPDDPIGGPDAVGHEWDVTLPLIPGSHTPNPSGYAPVVLAQGRINPSSDPVSIRLLDYHCDPKPTDDQTVIISEITDWVRPDGGRVLSIGSIAAGRALHRDAKMAAFVRNALHHNGVVFRLGLTAIGADGRFYAKSFDGNAWSASWEDAGPGFGEHASNGIQWSPKGLANMAITPGGNFRYRFQLDGAAWSAWTDFGGAFLGQPAAAAWGRNRLDLFARGAGGSIHVKSWNGRSWSSWLDLGVLAGSSPAAVAFEGRKLAVAVLDTAGNVLVRTTTNSNWETSWTDLGGGPCAHAPTLVTTEGKSLALLAVSSSGELLACRRSEGNWSAWTNLGGTLASRVHVASTGKDSFRVFARASDGRIVTRAWSGTAWDGWADLGSETFLGEPAVASFRGSHLALCATSTSGHLLLKTWSGSVWSGWQDMGGDLRPSPALFRWIAG